MMEDFREFLCYGNWDSWLNEDDDDGFFDLRVDDSGHITGYHYLDNGERIDVTGTCEHSGQHYIELKEVRRGIEYFYSARIIPKNSTNKHKTKNGTCRIHRKRKVDDEVCVNLCRNL